MIEYRFTIIVPCYNEENAILETLSSLQHSLRDAGDYELIVVNDGSTDGSSIILEKAKKEHANIRVVNHVRNKGYGAALKTGIRKANCNIIVITDADGTYPNERIPELVNMLESEDADMLVGARTAEGEVTYPTIRKIPKWFLTRYCSWIACRDIPDINSGLRVFRKDIAERFFNIFPDGFSFTVTITLAMLTNHYDVRYVPIGYSARIGNSKIKPIRDTLNFIQLIVRTGMYFAPLRVLLPVAGFLGLCFLTSLAYDLYQLNLTEKTLMLMIITINTGLFALLADMIDKRSAR